MKTKQLKNKSFTDSFNNAIAGLKYAFRSERNIKVHVIAGLLVILASLFLDITRTDLLILCFTISLVIIAELINTAIEVVVNTMIKVYHPKAKIIKDVSAAAVLVASLNAIIVGYLIFIDRLDTGLQNVLFRLKQYQPNVVLIAVLITVVVVIVIKIIYNKGTPLRGGMPSGHAAIAFSITTAIALWFQNIIVVLLCLFLAVLVAQSRVEGKIHNIYEVVVGGIIGILITLFIYKLFNAF